ncbi:GNAT family N-acetyltransferase [Bordetella petrii]|uniref:GNAT family N-acetyltransferase n=1 Tax=Bordetella petrii TaxID=94624 RepID=UPI001E4A843A|nr:GNAT family N-acetyltransferase [Bordetella petrii]MCD0505861.1 GNAT family N-acetyltransferase [Bordetella petrii]
MSHDQPAIEIRRAMPDDDAEPLTALLHRAYARLGAMGLNFMAVDQSAEVTRQRMLAAECYLALLRGTIVGTVVFKPPARTRGSPWLDRPDVAGLAQLAVDPAMQQCGLGARLVDWAEARAAACGAREIALDTAEPAEHLRAWYERQGYRVIEYAQWAHANYRSVVMSKPLA